MYQRHMRTSMGAVWRPLSQEISAVSDCTARSFHFTARRLEDDRSNSPPASASPLQRETRQVRARSVFEKIDNLQGVRPASDQPSHSLIRTTQTGPSTRATQMSSANRTSNARPPYGRTNAESRPLIQRPGENVGAPPPGTMARAPAQLRITRTSTPEGPGRPTGGPNFGPRGGPDTPSRAPGRRGESGPMKRTRKKDGSDKKGGKGVKGKSAMGGDFLTVEEGLTDGMVQQLLRLQRKEWDTTQYVPKYAHGSQAATELIEEGKKLFEGSKPQEKVWGRLEKRIGIVGMHGA